MPSTSHDCCPLQAEVRPWLIADSKCQCTPEEAPDPRKTVFIGGVPRPMKACELADIMDKRFGTVTFAAIDLDTDVNYPKGEQLTSSHHSCWGYAREVTLLVTHSCMLIKVQEGSHFHQPTASWLQWPLASFR